MDKQVTVIIPNFNGRAMLDACLNGLREQKYASFRTILVDNGSKDGSVEYVSEHFPEVEIMALPRNVGFSAAINAAMKNIRTRFTALLNNDAVPHPRWLKNLVHGLEIHQDAGFAASKMLQLDHPDFIDRAGDAYTRAGTGWLRMRQIPLVTV